MPPAASGFFNFLRGSSRFNPLYFRLQSLEKWRMPICRKLFLRWSLVCFFFAAVSAMAAGPSSTPFLVDTWKVGDGLPDNAVIAVLQASDGYLWAGTQYGLVRFDGSRFKTFDEMNTPGLNSDRVIFLYQDRQTNLWIGTETAGLAMVHNGVVKSFQIETAQGGRISAASEDSGGIYFFCEGGISRYHDGQMTFYPRVYSPQSYLMAGHWLVPSRDGGVWQLQTGAVEKWNGNKIVKNFGPLPWGRAPIKAACEDANGNLIVGTLGAGIFWFEADGHYWHLTQTNGLSSDYILSLCADNEGDLWAGTDGGGLDRIKRKLFDSPKNFHPWAVQSLSEDADGGVWAAFGAPGATYVRGQIANDYQIGMSHEAWEVLVDRRQEVWAGSQEEGLFLLQTNHFLPAPGAGEIGSSIFALYESRDGKIWAGTEKGLGCWDGKNWTLTRTTQKLSDNPVRAIVEDANSNLWVGTGNGGLSYFNGNLFVSNQTTADGLPGNDVSCLYLDGDGVLWVGTAGHGLARWENGKWACFSATNGLASDSIGYLIGDGGGNLWIGSNIGLMQAQKKSQVEMNFLSCRVYGTADGLPTPECSSGSQPAAIRTRDGRILFPTTEGLVSVDPAQLKPNQRPPQVLIESVLVDGQEQNTNPLDSAWSPVVQIPPGSEQLEIHYTALNFSSPQNVRFKYRLAGQNNWTDAGDGRVARYTGLPPGHYNFYVIACNEDGVWNMTGAALDITVSPQFWQTTTFQGVAVAVLLALVIGIVRYVSTQKLHRQLQTMKQQEALERERARIARDLHDQLGANLTQVALLGEMAEADKNLPDEVESHSKQISQTARETTRSLDEIVWAINPSNDTLEGLANYVCKYAQEYLALANLPCRMDVPAQLPAAAIPPEVRHNVFLAFKEAVHNVVKHAQASEVWIRLRLRPKGFILQVQDNGRGMNPQEPTTRNGLRNMKKRMADIGGDFSVSSGASGGTLVELTVSLS
jgi:signal transduction histidine kinase/ligand-binding sensor domain-containing protein